MVIKAVGSHRRCHKTCAAHKEIDCTGAPEPRQDMTMPILAERRGLTRNAFMYKSRRKCHSHLFTTVKVHQQANVGYDSVLELLIAYQNDPNNTSPIADNFACEQ